MKKFEAAKHQGQSGTPYNRYLKKTTARYNRRKGKLLLEDAPNNKQRRGWIT